MADALNIYDVSRLNAISGSLIYDRTQADVDYALMLESEGIHTDEDLRGAYNASDRNRVSGAINYIAALLRLSSVEAKSDWKSTNIVRNEDNANTLDSLNSIMVLLPVNAELPGDLDRLSYQKANGIERALFEIYGVYSRMNGFFIGDGYASDFDAADEQAFDDNWKFD